jgi:hypothetical protein
MSDEILELFWYSSEERELFPYIDDYMIALENWLDENELDDKQLVRYMLAGLFLEYRAANHMDKNFHTIIYEWTSIYLIPKTRQKFQTINKDLGSPIQTTEEYLQRLQAQNAADFARLYRRLFDFVVYGKY